MTAPAPSEPTMFSRQMCATSCSWSLLERNWVIGSVRAGFAACRIPGSNALPICFLDPDDTVNRDVAERLTHSRRPDHFEFRHFDGLAKPEMHGLLVAQAEDFTHHPRAVRQGEEDTRPAAVAVGDRPLG